MKNSMAVILAIVLLAQFKVSAQVDTVLDRYRRHLFQSESARDVRPWLSSLDTAGYWPDIDYTNESRAEWQMTAHLDRVQAMAAAWADPASESFHHPELKQAIDRALDYWLYHRFYNPNWWYNEIGVPRYMKNIMVLLDTHLSRYQRTRVLEQLDQYRINGTASNLIWSAELGFFYGAFTGNTLLMRHCMDTVLHEIRINTGEGIQPDFSFHMHGNRLQIYSYGTAYLKEILQLALECKGTVWALPPDKAELLADFILKGWQWMARGINTVPGTVDRSVSRRNILRAADIRKLIPGLMALAPARARGLQEVLDRQQGKGAALTGFRYFPYSDFVAYQQEEFSFFLKTRSNRTLPSESINGENLKGRLLNGGDAYLIRDGNEYFNMMPVWNWDKLPGITTFDGAGEIVGKSFTGSAGDGESGLTAMDYEMRGRDTAQKIRAHKMWAYHQGYVVCLIAGLTAKNIGGEIYTVLDQCRLQGPVIENKITHKIDHGRQVLNDVRWLYHHGFAYLPVSPSSVDLYTGAVEGAWKSIDASASDSLVSDSVFMPVLVHGRDVQNMSAGYVLTYSARPAEISALSEHRKWEIVRNDTTCQAVLFGDGTVAAAFFHAGSIRWDAGKTLAVNKPCLLLLSRDKLYAGNPGHREEEISITFNGRKLTMHLPADGTAAFFKLSAGEGHKE